MIFIFFLKIFSSFLCASPLRLEVNKGRVEPEPISIPDFEDDDTKSGAEVSKIIRNDLKNSGLFLIVNQNEQTNSSILNNGVNYRAWLKSRYLVAGSITNEEGRISIKFRIYDILLKKELEGVCVSGSFRKAAHAAADKIYERITGEAGFFCTRFLLVESYVSGKKMYKKLVLVDQDGEGRKEVVSNKEKFVLSAKAAPDGTIAYLAIVNNKVHLYYKNQIISQNKDKHYAFNFLNNDELIISSAKRGTSALYLLDLHSFEKTLLTEHRSIHTSPSPSHESSKILYTSDEKGVEKVYAMDKDGSNRVKISQGNGKYSQPCWSPRGDLIAFVKQKNGSFYLGVMGCDGGSERLIHSGYLIERPCFAENGRYISFVAGERSGRSKICMIDITGNPLSYRCIRTKGNACDVSWIGKKKSA